MLAGLADVSPKVSSALVRYCPTSIK